MPLHYRKYNGYRLTYDDCDTLLRYAYYPLPKGYKSETGRVSLYVAKLTKYIAYMGYSRYVHCDCLPHPSPEDGYIYLYTRLSIVSSKDVPIDDWEEKLAGDCFCDIVFQRAKLATIPVRETFIVEAY